MTPAPPPLLGRIPMGLSLIVEIGCGDGALGAILARRDPGARLVATTADPAAASRARPFYEAVHVAPPEAGAPLPAGSADLVLLHGPMADPAAAIRAAVALLAPSGILMAEVPNDAHWRLAEALLRPDAPIPRPPTPAMSREALGQVAQAAGLAVLDIGGVVREGAEAKAFAELIAPGLAALGTTAEAWLARGSPSTWLLRASRVVPPPLHILAHVLKPVGGVNDVRIDLPLAAVATWPRVSRRIVLQSDAPALPPGMPRVLVLHRRLLHTLESLRVVQHFRERGWVVVQEFDDDPAHWPVIPASNHLAFRGVHAVQTTTPRLEALFRTFNDEVAVFPNTVAELPVQANFADPSRLTLFLGALRREDDFAPYLPVLNGVLAEAGERLAVEVIFDRATFDALRTGHKRFHPLLPYGEYRALLSRCEIAFMPLADTRFNNFKSDLKFVEAGAHGVCCLANPVVYGDTIRHGETGIVLRTPGEFGAALRGLLADPDRARAMGAAARAWVRDNRMLASQAPRRLAWYRSLWERRAELDAAMVVRTPELTLLA